MKTRFFLLFIILVIFSLETFSQGKQKKEFEKQSQVNEWKSEFIQCIFFSIFKNYEFSSFETLDELEACIQLGAYPSPECFRRVFNLETSTEYLWKEFFYRLVNSQEVDCLILLSALRGIDDGFELKDSLHFISGSTLLHLAAFKGNLNLVRALILKGVDPLCKNEDGKTPLHEAVASGSLELSQYLLEQHADLECEDKDGWRPLHYAALNGNFKLVTFLLQQGAEINSATKSMDTALSLAVYLKDVQMVLFLIKQGANIYWRSEDECTLLHEAAWRGALDLILIFLDLEERILEVNAKSKTGATALSVAASKGYLEVVHTLIAWGANVHLEDKNRGWLPLHGAVFGGHLQVVKELLARGSDINAQSKRKQTALYIAILEGHYEVFKFLIEQGANVDLQEEKGDTVLHLLARGRVFSNFSLKMTIKAVEILLKKQASLSLKNKEGQTSIQLSKSLQGCTHKITRLMRAELKKRKDANDYEEEDLSEAGKELSLSEKSSFEEEASTQVFPSNQTLVPLSRSSLDEGFPIIPWEEDDDGDQGDDARVGLLKTSGQRMV